VLLGEVGWASGREDGGDRVYELTVFSLSYFLLFFLEKERNGRFSLDLVLVWFGLVWFRGRKTFMPIILNGWETVGSFFLSYFLFVWDGGLFGIMPL
jgi:hypothetical protein